MWVQLLEATGPLQSEIEATRRALLGDAPASREGAAQVLARILPRAFRRPIKAAETAPFLAVYDRDLARSGDHLRALRESLKTVLTSPQFLYRNSGAGPLGDFEIATRLSYFLWGTMPDRELFGLASEGRLRDPATRAAQVDRLLADARSDRFVRSFTDYWLQLHRVGETKPGFRTKPAYNATLEEDIRTETRLFFREILHGDLDVANFLDSDWTMLNEKMAELYGLKDRGITGTAFRRISLEPEDRRGGLLTQSSFACLTSNGSETQPILRGVWIIQNILGQNLEPPKGTEPIETDSRGATSMLDQIRLHRDAEACQGCHIKIDPLGIALENYGVIGNWRDSYRSKLPIVTTVEEYSDLSGPDGVKEFLAARAADFEIALINRLKEHALGRETTYYDLHRTRQMAAAPGAGLKTLLKAIVADESLPRPLARPSPEPRSPRAISYPDSSPPCRMSGGLEAPATFYPAYASLKRFPLPIAACLQPLPSVHSPLEPSTSLHRRASDSPTPPPRAPSAPLLHRRALRAGGDGYQLRAAGREDDRAPGFSGMSSTPARRRWAGTRWSSTRRPGPTTTRG